jgi:cell wall-associated NlpC family hydrolase
MRKKIGCLLTALFMSLLVGNSAFAAVNPMEKAVVWALQIAADNRHGYSQGAENATANNPYTGSREGPDYDCSSLVYHALEQAGFPIIAAWQKNPDYYKLYDGKQLTGDADTIWPDLQKIGGFTKYSWAEVKDNLQRGDILCRPEAHVAIYIGDGKTVEARGVNNPKGGEYRTGDQGGEIDCYSAYGRGWTEVYRYTGK